jgi:hypothetical protein
MNLIPFHGFGFAETFSALTRAEKISLQPRSRSTGSGR